VAKTGILDRIINTTRLNQKAVIFITCVFLSIVFWVFTSLSRVYETRISIPVSYRNIPFTRNVEGELPASLDFHFKGTGFELARTHLRNQPDSIAIDVSAAIDKKNQLRLSTLTLKNQFPGDIKAYKITPEIIAPDLSQRSSKRVPVNVISQITFKNRFGQGGKIIVRPDSVDIAGAADLLTGIQEIKTENIVLNDVAGNYFGSSMLIKSLPKGVTVSSKYVYFYVPVEEYTEGTFDVPVELPMSQRGRVTLFPPVVKVVYMVPLKYFDRVKSSDFKASTEIPSSYFPDLLEVTLQKTPHFLGKIQIQPDLIDYYIQE